MNMNFDSASIELTCPKCAHKFKERVGRLKNNPTLPCPKCRSAITIKAEGLRDGLKAAEKSIADFKASLGKRFK